ncbi:MAG TPA: hypothetical protein GXX18_05715 [Bacillales bacterium]|nr:hypothetical protein [Bacillales bacterium]
MSLRKGPQNLDIGVKVGYVGGFVFAYHAGAISASLLTTIRYRIGVYLFGKNK